MLSPSRFSELSVRSLGSGSSPPFSRCDCELPTDYAHLAALSFLKYFISEFAKSFHGSTTLAFAGNSYHCLGFLRSYLGP